MRRIESLFVKRQKGCPPEETDSLELYADGGITGDIHSCKNRQVCLVFSDTARKIDSLKGRAPCIDRFSCNVVVSGNRPENLSENTEIRLAGAAVKITGAGRECHGLCSIEDCPLIDGVFFGCITEDGSIKTGDKVLI